MNDLELLFVRGSIQEENLEEDENMLIEICNRIADSTTANEYDYWTERRRQYFAEGAEAVQNTIEEDIKDNRYPEESSSWNRGDVKC